MESLGTLTCSTSSSMTSPRWPCARLASVRTSLRDLREMARPNGAPAVVAAAFHHQFASAPLPATLKAANARQWPVSTASATEQTAFWSMQSSVCSLIQTKRYPDLSLEAFIRNPLEWLMNLVHKLQSTLAHLFAGPQSRASIQAARDGTGRSSASTATSHSKAAAAATCESTTRRCSSGRYVPVGAAQRGNDAAEATTRLVATQAVPIPVAQPRVPVIALAVTTAAALACGSYWLFRRWREMVELQREQAQRAAVKKDNLARQKQRFQRALVVDSVNLELPPIKDMDVQPAVRVEKIISQSPSQLRDPSAGSVQRGSTVPGLAGESLRQWQQFMAASRAKEVTNVTGNQRGGRGAAEQAADRPYVALDDRMLADLSDRIRRANEMTAAGEVPPPMPVITFEQLYANNQESDDEAMARRAAERKARWQKQHPVASTAAPAARSNVSARPPPAPPVKKPAPVPASKPRPQTVNSDNPFAAGLFTSSSATTSTSTGASTSIVGRPSSARGGAIAQEPKPSHTEIVTASSSPGARASGRNPFMEPAATASSVAAAHTGTTEASGSGGQASGTEISNCSADGAPPSLPEQTENAKDVRSIEITAAATMPTSSEALANRSDVENGNDTQPPLEPSVSCEERTNSGASQSHGGDSPAGRRPVDDLTVPSPGRTRRSPAAGQLRTPETQAPALTRLMRRPGAASANGDEPKSRLVMAVGDELKGRVLLAVGDEPNSRADVANLQLSEVAP